MSQGQELPDDHPDVQGIATGEELNNVNPDVQGFLGLPDLPDASELIDRIKDEITSILARADGIDQTLRHFADAIGEIRKVTDQVAVLLEKIGQMNPALLAPGQPLPQPPQGFAPPAAGGFRFPFPPR